MQTQCPRCLGTGKDPEITAECGLCSGRGHINELEELYDDYGKAYQFREFYIPNYMMGGIARYIEHGIPPEDFLTAIICNDLKGAVGMADDTNIRNLPAYVAYFYNEAPNNCWGSLEKMNKWVGKFFNKEKLDD